jgi:hypothetical protein
MKTDSNPYMTTFEIVMKYLGILMALIYVITGITVVYRSRELFNIPQPYVVPMGIGLISYGLFRGYRLYNKYFKKSS